jgi:hypothetical protein
VEHVEVHLLQDVVNLAKLLHHVNVLPGVEHPLLMLCHISLLAEVVTLEDSIELILREQVLLAEQLLLQIIKWCAQLNDSEGLLVKQMQVLISEQSLELWNQERHALQVLGTEFENYVENVRAAIKFPLCVSVVEDVDLGGQFKRIAFRVTFIADDKTETSLVNSATCVVQKRATSLLELWVVHRLVNWSYSFFLG